MFITPNTAPHPVFSRSRLAVARDIAVLTVCVGIILGFLIEVWKPSPAARHYNPAMQPAALLLPT